MNPRGSDEVRRIHLGWLIRLRWGALIGQVLLIAAVRRLLHLPIPLLPLGLVMAAEAATNLLARRRLRSERDLGQRWLVGLLTLDLLLLSTLLYFTGGPQNPFSFLYLVHISLAAIVLPPRRSWALVALALACSGVLFLFNVPLPPPDNLDHSQHGSRAEHEAHLAHREHTLHLQGMWVAFGVAAGFIVYILHRLVGELRTREEQLRSAQEASLRQERLASLVTLAAGAAHELATPLSSIAVVARELQRELELRSTEPRWLDDVSAIRQEVGRCRTILGRLSSDAGQPGGEAPTEAPLAALAQGALEGLPGRHRVQVTLEPADATLYVPLNTLAQALRNLLDNALAASAPAQHVRLGVTATPTELTLTVEDDGAGMEQEVLARATEPFFSTKPTGQGMGLGLFLVRRVAEQLGGELSLGPKPPHGTLARLRLPLSGPHALCRLVTPAPEAPHHD